MVLLSVLMEIECDIKVIFIAAHPAHSQYHHSSFNLISRQVLSYETTTQQGFLYGNMAAV